MSRLDWVLKKTGIDNLIFAGIVAGIPGAIGQALESARQGDLNELMLLVVLLIAVAVVYFVVFIERGQRRLTVNYAQRQGRKAYSAQTSHLPLKVNMAGVIPAIFASSLLLFPASISQWFGQGVNAPAWLQDISLLIGPGQPLYVLLFSALIIFFSGLKEPSLLTNIPTNATQYSHDTPYNAQQYQASKRLAISHVKTAIEIVINAFHIFFR